MFFRAPETGLLGKGRVEGQRQQQQQIPFGNDSQKGKGKHQRRQSGGVRNPSRLLDRLIPMDIAYFEGDNCGTGETVGMAETEAARKRNRTERRAVVTQRFTISLSIMSLLVAVWGQYHTYRKDSASTQSADSRFAKIETAIRLLTSVTAPQLQKGIDDSFSKVLNTDQAQPTKQNLVEIANSAKLLKIGKIAADPEQVASRTRAAEQVIYKLPQLPESWDAASSVVDYNSASRVGFADPPRNSCFETKLLNYAPHPPEFNSRKNTTLFGKCTLVIDDFEGFNKSIYGHIYADEVRAGVTDTFGLYLQDVNIVYRGGRLIPFVSLVCVNCTFTLETSGLPPPYGRRLVQMMLAATDGNFDSSSKSIPTSGPS